MITDYLKPYFKHYNAHIWRKKSFWTEDCDLAIKQQYKTLQKVFEKYVNKAQKQVKALTVTEFAEII